MELKKISDLKPAAYNPRMIDEKSFEGLKFSLTEFGDLSGIVFNKRTGNLVTGHQRVKALIDEYGDIEASIGEDGSIAFVTLDGIFYMATRCKESVDKRSRMQKCSQKARVIEFLDKNNFAATFRQGNWTLQKFHSKESLTELLIKYFDEVQVYSGTSQNYAICKGPKRFAESIYKNALENEFNMEYPGGFRHNHHQKIVDAILQRVRERNVS